MRASERVSWSCIAFVLLLMPMASAGYSFQEQSPVQDSVRLVLNEQESSGDIVAIDAELYNVPAISAGGFYLYIDDPSVLKWAGIFTHDPDGYVKGDFFDDSSAIYLIGPLYNTDSTRNDSVLIVGVSDFDNPVSGSGTMITMKFRIVGTGTTDLVFYDGISDLNPAGSTWLGGTFTADDVPPQEPEQDDPPVVTLTVPDSEVYDTGDVDLSCYSSDDYGLSQVSLYTNIGGQWLPYQTVYTDQNLLLQAFSLVGLNEGTYRWNCRATDTESQSSFADNDHVFTVEFPADNTPPQIYNTEVMGDLSSNGTITIIVETMEPATCRYSPVQGIPFISMVLNLNENSPTNHSVALDVQIDREYYYYVKCEDAQGNSNQVDEVITFSVGSPDSDSQAPVILGFSPEDSIGADYGFSYLTVITDEDSECRYSQTGGLDFDFMTPFTVTNSKNHSETISVIRATDYTYYVKCRDQNGNVNTDTQISFFVCYEVDSDCSRSVDMGELNSHINRWYVNSRDVTMIDVMEAVRLWRGGSA